MSRLVAFAIGFLTTWLWGGKLKAWAYDRGFLSGMRARAENAEQPVRRCEATTTRAWTGTGTDLACVRDAGHAGPHRAANGHTYFDAWLPGD